MTVSQKLKGRCWIQSGLAAIILGWSALSPFAAEDPSTVDNLQGKWVLETLRGHPVPPTVEIFLEIEGKTIRGFDGCNEFGGRIDQPESIRQGQRACEGEYLALPLDLTNPLEHLLKAKITEDLLILPIPNDNATANFRRQ